MPAHSDANWCWAAAPLQAAAKHGRGSRPRTRPATARTTSENDVLIAGVAGLVAGAMSMAAGEYVSVSSQSDTEKADLAREREELRENVEFEQGELAEIYVKRGVDQALARRVAQQLMAKDALSAHARDELGISEITTARPVQAALTSAATFAAGAAFWARLVQEFLSEHPRIFELVADFPFALRERSRCGLHIDHFVRKFAF